MERKPGGLIRLWGATLCPLAASLSLLPHGTAKTLVNLVRTFTQPMSSYRLLCIFLMILDIPVSSPKLDDVYCRPEPCLFLFLTTCVTVMNMPGQAENAL